MSEIIVLVNEAGEEIGRAEKLASHHADTPLHRAFSCYIFNEKGEFLMTQRAHVKKVWPGVWTNSVCGHPAPNEETEDAIRRRVDYELGAKVKGIELLISDYTYKTPPFKGIIEHEYCPIYVARISSDLHLNPKEVENAEWIAWKDFIAKAEIDSNKEFSWWCKDQLKQLKEHPLIKKYSKS